MGNCCKATKNAQITCKPRELPLELITEVLTRLPVESLLRFRCVSKSLCTIIDSPHFINSHFIRSAEDKQLLWFIMPKSTQPSLYNFLIELGAPRDTSNHCYGYCNGVFLLPGKVTESQLALWNPATLQLRNLPTFPGHHKFHLNFGEYNSVGMDLGYDSSRDEYKVVIIEPVASVKPPAIVDYRVWIFGLRSNSRRSVSIDFRARASARDCGYCFGHFANGDLHWLFGEEANSLQLVAFDLAKETYSISPKPDYDPVKGTLADLHVLDGCLCMSFYNSRPQACLYIRKNDGEELTWSLLFSATGRELPSFLNTYNFYCGVLGRAKEGDKIFLDLGVECVVLYDNKEKCFRPTGITFPERGIAHRARSYVDSLVSVHTSLMAQ